MFDVIIPASGTSERIGFDKLNQKMNDATVLQRTVNVFLGLKEIDKIIVTGLHPDLSDVICVQGGKTRSESVQKALQYVTADYVLIHDGARPYVTKELIKSVMEATATHGSGIPTLPLTDTVIKKEGDLLTKPIVREDFVAVQTPQGFDTQLLKKAFALGYDKISAGFYTDESSLYSEFIAPCHTVAGSRQNKKITYSDDFYGINAKVGTGYDLHRFTENKRLRLCGTDIPYEYGLLAHSDGDVCLHALMDALLTASSERDIGVLFPDTDPAYKDINSVDLLAKVTDILASKNLIIQSVNIVIIAQNPKLSPYIEKMRNNLSAFLKVSSDKIGISATTTEGVGIIGESKAIASFATVILI